jgi:hypothetical protein
MPFAAVIFVGLVILLVSGIIRLEKEIKSEKKLEEEKAQERIKRAQATSLRASFIQEHTVISGIVTPGKITRTGLSYSGSILDSKYNDEGSIPSEPATPYDCVDCGSYTEQKYWFIGDLPMDNQFPLCGSCHDKHALYLRRGDKIKSGLVRVEL